MSLSNITQANSHTLESNNLNCTTVNVPELTTINLNEDDIEVQDTVECLHLECTDINCGNLTVENDSCTFNGTVTNFNNNVNVTGNIRLNGQLLNTIINSNFESLTQNLEWTFISGSPNPDTITVVANYIRCFNIVTITFSPVAIQSQVVGVVYTVVSNPIPAQFTPPNINYVPVNFIPSFTQISNQAIGYTDYPGVISLGSIWLNNGTEPPSREDNRLYMYVQVPDLPPDVGSNYNNYMSGGNSVIPQRSLVTVSITYNLQG